jgi:hypothetical protein
MLQPLTLDHTPEFTLPVMTNSLHLPARPGAPIACDMSTADDTPEERLREYGRLFQTALLRRERRTDSVSFWFRADPGTRDALEALARREAACCPFLDYRVEAAGDELVWTTTGDDRAAIQVFLDALHALPDDQSNSGEDALKPLNVR